MELTRLIGRRLVQLLIVLIVVSFFTFLLIRLLPGDPTQVIIPFGTAHQRAQLRTDLGLNKSFLAQYWDYLTGLVQGHLGHQYNSGRPVSELVNQSLPVSLELMIYAQVIALAFAIPLGVFAAYRAGTRADNGINTTAFAFLALPNFVLALVLSFFIGAKLKWLPTGGVAPGWPFAFFGSMRQAVPLPHLLSILFSSSTHAALLTPACDLVLRSVTLSPLPENLFS